MVNPGPCTLLAKQRDSRVKQTVFRNVKKLQGNSAFKNVRIVNDLTRREKEHEITLWNEAKNLETAGKGKHIVVGPPWSRKVVKSRMQKPTNMIAETPVRIAEEVQDQITQNSTMELGTVNQTPQENHGAQERN